MLKITKTFNAIPAQMSSKGMYLTPIFNLELYIRTVTIFLNLFQPKLMQVFSLKIQYSKVLGDFFKNWSIKGYEFQMNSNSTVRHTF